MASNRCFATCKEALSFAQPQNCFEFVLIKRSFDGDQVDNELSSGF